MPRPRQLTLPRLHSFPAILDRPARSVRRSPIGGHAGTNSRTGCWQTRRDSIRDGFCPTPNCSPSTQSGAAPLWRPRRLRLHFSARRSPELPFLDVVRRRGIAKTAINIGDYPAAPACPWLGLFFFPVRADQVLAPGQRQISAPAWSSRWGFLLISAKRSPVPDRRARRNELPYWLLVNTSRFYPRRVLSYPQLHPVRGCSFVAAPPASFAFQREALVELPVVLDVVRRRGIAKTAISIGD